MAHAHRMAVMSAEGLLHSLREGMQTLALFSEDLSANLLPPASEAEAAKEDLDNARQDTEAVARDMWAGLEKARDD